MFFPVNNHGHRNPVSDLFDKQGFNQCDDEKVIEIGRENDELVLYCYFAKVSLVSAMRHDYA